MADVETRGLGVADPHPAAPGQESVWSRPGPPEVRPTDDPVMATQPGARVTSSRRAPRAVATSDPPSHDPGTRIRGSDG